MSEWYRYQDSRVASPLNEWDEPSGPGRAVIRMESYRVISETPKGVWLDLGFDLGRRFVLLGARKRWACPTPDEALQSFLARKRRQLGILRAQIAHIEEALRRAAEETVDA